ncbi:MAG: hypothetical protein AB7O66_09100 [Limisphaerales bacterium]
MAEFQAFEGTHVVFLTALSEIGGGEVENAAAAQIDAKEVGGGILGALVSGIVDGGSMPVAVPGKEVEVGEILKGGEPIGDPRVKGSPKAGVKREGERSRTGWKKRWATEGSEREGDRATGQIFSTL